MAKDNIKSAVSLTELPLEMLEAYRNTVVKSANQKARRLESWAQKYNEKNPKHPTKVLRFAHDKYTKENQRLYGSERGREKQNIAEKLSTEKEKNRYRQQLMHQIKAAETFMSAESSSGKTYMDIAKRKAQTLKETYSIDITPEDLTWFFDSPQFARWKEKYAYYTTSALASIGNVMRDENVGSLREFVNEFFVSRGEGRTLGVRVKKIKKPVTDVVNKTPKKR